MILTWLLALAPAIAVAQGVPAPAEQPLPRDVRREVVERWNGAVEFRAVDRTSIDSSQTVDGDVAVLRGPLTIAGHVHGDVLAINSDVILLPAARIDGSLLVVGGEIEGQNAAHVEHGIRIYRQSLAYRQDGDRIVGIDQDDAAVTENWWRRFERHREDNWTDVLRVVQAGPYNRVEGLPIELGPALQRRTPWGSVLVNAAAILRTGSTFDSDRGDVGHAFRGEVRAGHDGGIGIGVRAFNAVAPIEAWQLSNLETALAAFVAHRDYRDYYERHGGNAYVTLFGARNLSLTGAFGEERWTSRETRRPFSLFDNDDRWRANPQVNEGLFHIGSLSLGFDTRTDPDDPWSGWFMSADAEHGRGGDVDYTRGFFDVRRYNRLGPKAQLNLRLVAGGWLGGDPLPFERRLSVDGPGALPGYGFRAAHAGPDVGTCNSGVITPVAAACDRIALAQIEYRGDLRIGFLEDWQDWPRRYHSAHGDVTWVVFADAGRGWRVSDGAPGVANITYGGGTLPSLSTFRSDIGAGLDFSGVGIYGAKSMSAPSEPMNFFVRLMHRF
jgi:hypothetical protein